MSKDIYHAKQKNSLRSIQATNPQSVGKKKGALRSSIPLEQSAKPEIRRSTRLAKGRLGRLQVPPVQTDTGAVSHKRTKTTSKHPDLQVQSNKPVSRPEQTKKALQTQASNRLPSGAAKTNLSKASRDASNHPSTRLSWWLEHYDPSEALPPDDRRLLESPEPADRLAPRQSSPIGSEMSQSIHAVSSLPTGTHATSKTSRTRKQQPSDEEYRKLLQIRRINALAKASADQHAFVNALRVYVSKCSSFRLRLSDLQMAGLHEVYERMGVLLDLHRNGADPTLDVEDVFEGVRSSLYRVAPRLRRSTSIAEDLKWDLDWAKEMGNEAAIQSTIMMSVVDRWRLSKKLSLEREAQWNKVEGEVAMPYYPIRNRGTASATDNANAQPGKINGFDDHMYGLPQSKPDLAVAFDVREMIENLNFPPELDGHVLPRANSPVCFPFLYIEAKKEDTKIPSARMRNLHHSGQALYSMYKCMQAAEQTEVFFKHIRTFSITMSASGYDLRVHRAIENASEEGLEYKYDTIREFGPYQQQEINALVQSIFVDYALPVMWKLLRATVQIISKSSCDGSVFNDLAESPPRYESIGKLPPPNDDDTNSEPWPGARKRPRTCASDDGSVAKQQRVGAENGTSTDAGRGTDQTSDPMLLASQESYGFSADGMASD